MNADSRSPVNTMYLPTLFFTTGRCTRCCSYRPQSASALLEISGVGQTKLDRYGERFLSILRDQALSA